MAPEGHIVTASAVPHEDSSGTTREIDIMIEGSVLGLPVCIAVECRSRSRKDSLPWIDELIGKYSDMHVTHIVAVNEAGFSVPAKKKANAHGITTETLESALTMDWPREAIKAQF